ncbi:putative DNA primase large subunit [Senna tora]|uniref:DNA primase large subunit n=1 Tax=Senna tora TaxID=362788 RepID=A0A835CCN1_9FABA|nr:putative DNA primase large subunit [Senna tora]
MEIVRSQSHRKISPNNVTNTLPLYRSAPPLEVRLEDFELYALDRLRVLKGISDGLSRGKRPEEMEKLVGKLWKENMRHQQASEIVNKDIISHFVLRLVYCRTEELRKWFLSMETSLFRYRFRLENAEAQRALMAEFDLSSRAVSNVEFESIKEKLGQVARSMGQSLPTADAIFYKVPFEEVPELVAGRKVFINQGFAYVAMTQAVSLVATLFRSLLSKALVLTNRKWTSTIREQEKDRLTPIVEALCSSYLGPDFSQMQIVEGLASLSQNYFMDDQGGKHFEPRGHGEISVKDIDQVAKSSFPLCMRNLLEKLREDHHLKHGGRMQLGLFLKGVGLNLDDALAFWRYEFSQKVGLERFEKEYAYSIRHNYGQEGKRTDYTAYSCQKIISSTPGVGDHHGCPYRHFSEENLRAALTRMGMNGRAMEDVMNKVRNRHYQLACTLTFEAIHGVPNDAGINHPTQYFSDSQKILQPELRDIIVALFGGGLGWCILSQTSNVWEGV